MGIFQFCVLIPAAGRLAALAPINAARIARGKRGKGIERILLHIPKYKNRAYTPF